MQDNTGQSELDGVVSIFQPISHPVLRSVDPVKVSQFLRERERYELEVGEKKKEVPSLTKASFKVSVDPGLLRRMHFLGRFSNIAPDKTVAQLSSGQIEQWIRSLVEREESTFDPAVIEKAVSSLRMPMSIADPEARIMEFCNDFLSRLEAVGYDNFKDVNPKKTVKLLQDKLYPKRFKAATQKTLDYHEPIQKDVVGYVDLLCEEAKAFEKYKLDERHTEKEKDKGGSRKRGGNSQPSVPTVRTQSRSDETSGQSRERNRPLCLNPICAKNQERHFVLNECSKTSKEEARKLVREYKEKKQNEKKEAKRVHCDDEGAKSTMVKAMLSRAIPCIVCADGGSDLNILSPVMLSQLLQKHPDVSVTTFATPRKYGLAAKTDGKGKEIFIACDKQVTTDLELFIRHGCYLELRNVVWYVSTTDLSEPILGRPLLEALGINTKDLLAAAVDRLGNTVDVATLKASEDYTSGTVARIISEGVYHQDKGVLSDIYNDEDEPWLDLGIDTVAEIDEGISEALRNAVEEGLSEKGNLDDLLKKYRDVLRLRLGNDPPAKVEPMTVEMQGNVKPVAAKARRYTPSGRKFMERYVDRLLEFEFGKVTTTAKWVAAPVLVAKPPPASFRLTFDYRPINAVTVPMTWPMPHIDSELPDMAGSKCFATIDFVSGYWQLPLAEHCQELLSFLSTDTVIQPTRCTQGAKNAGPNFQSKVQPLFSEIKDRLKAWLDDFVLHVETEDDLIETLGKFLRICRDANLKISIRKSKFFLKKVHWCGRIIDGSGVQFDPRNLSGLKGLQLPITAGELCEYVHCLQWMAQSIPDFTNRIEPLKEILEEAYQQAGSRTKRAVQRIRLDTLSWNNQHEDTYKEFQTELGNLVKLAHRDTGKVICIYTDASDAHWSAVVTQTTHEDLKKELGDQKHEPLAFLGGTFKGAEEFWTTFEKEAYAIYMVFKKLDYMLLAEEDIHVYTDHRNLLFVFNPLALDPALGRHVVNKVQRWALYLSKFAYVIEHIAGDKNLMADILTRWCRGYRGKRLAVKRITHKLLEQDVISTPLAEDFKYPDIAMIHTSQVKHDAHAPHSVSKKENGLWTVEGKIWIPEQDNEMQIKLLVVSHCGLSGHRGCDATLSVLKETFFWKNMQEDTWEFVAACLHCVIGKAGHKIPRPISLTTHATRPNEVIHFDFLYMGPGCAGMKYILVVRDDLSSYIWLTSAKQANAETAADGLANWIRVFTVMSLWVSDQGSHFKNRIMKELAEEHNIKHRITVAYSPWVNGTVERCMKTIQEAFRCLQSELRLGPQDWPSVVGMIQTIMNEAPIRRLGSRGDGTLRTPLEVVTGIRPTRTMLQANQNSKSGKAVSLEKARALQVVDIDSLQSAFDKMHKDVSEKVSANRARQIKHHNKKTNLVQPNFNVGDFVLVRRAQNKGHKQAFRWVGPRRITGIVGEMVYDVENLLTHKVMRVHAARILLYRADLDGKKLSEDLMKHHCIFVKQLCNNFWRIFFNICIARTDLVAPNVNF